MKHWLPALLVAAFSLPQGAARDAAPRFPRGTAEISGVVVSDDASAKPLRMATVTLSGGGLPSRPVTVTDDEGKFNFGELPAGRFSLSALKPGYIQMDYGATRPGGDGMPVVLEAGGHTQIAITLPKAAAISGTIKGPDGEPASNARVMLMEYQTTSRGGRELGPPNALPGWRWQLLTDDRGAYRFYGMPAGEYYVIAQPHFSWELAESNARLIGQADFDWARNLLQSTGATPPTPPAARSLSFATVFFPGTVDVDGAVPIKVGNGEDRAAVDFTMQLVPTATLSGTVLGPDGGPLPIVQATMLMPSLSIFLYNSVHIAPGPDGRFTASGVRPGDYVLAARGATNTESKAMPLWALLDVRVDGRDMSNLDVRLQPGVTVSGRLNFAGTAARPADLKTVRLSLSPTYESVMSGSADTQIGADGAFTISGVAPGRYRLSTSVPTPTGGTQVWTARSAVVGGQDALDFPFEVRSGVGISDALVTFTDRPTEIAGTLFDANDRPTPKFFIVVFPTDRSYWLPSSRRVRSARPGDTGAYRFAGLPPGEYFVAVATDFDQDELYTTPFLESLVALADKITVGEGEKIKKDLKVGASEPAGSPLRARTVRDFRYHAAVRSRTTRRFP